MAYIIGLDEVGTGAFAGPAVVCAVVAPIDWSIPEVKDSKAFKGKRDRAHLARSSVYDLLQAQAPFISWELMWLWPEDIDRIGLGRAVWGGFQQLAVKTRLQQPEAEIVLDGNIRLKNIANYRSFPKADALVPVVSAASVIAKVERDRWMMTEGDSSYPAYDFISNVGYSSPTHQAALQLHGPCPLHRQSFRPIRELIARRDSARRDSARRDSARRDSGSPH